MNIFISYSRANRPQVEALEAMLRALGNSAWFDRDISAGDEWWRAIIAQIQSCDIFVFALSPQSTSSPACQAEFSYARALNKPILPILLKEAELPEGSLTELQYVDARNIHANATALALSRALLNLQGRILAGEYRPPAAPPSPPPIPHHVDPLSDARRQVANLQEAKTAELAHAIYTIKQVVRENRSLTNEARAILTTIIESPEVSQGIAAEARETLRTLPGAQRRSGISTIGFVVVAVAVLAVIGILLVPPSIMNPPSPTPTPTESGAVTEASSVAALPSDTPSAAPTEPDAEPTVSPAPTVEASADSANTPVFPVNTTSPTRQPTVETSTRSATEATEDATVAPSESPTATNTWAVPTRTPAATETPITFSSDNFDAIAELPESPLLAHEEGSAVRALAFSADGRLMASGGADTYVTLWSTETWEQIGAAFSPASSVINSVALSPQGDYLAVGMANRTFEVYALDERRILTFNGRHNNQVTDLQFSPDGELLAVGSADGTVSMWRAPSGDSVRTLLFSREAGVLQTTFSPDGGLLAATGSDGMIKIWDVATGLMLESAQVLDEDAVEAGDNIRLNGLAFGGTSRSVAVAVGGQDGDGYVRVWETRNDEIEIATGLSDKLLSDMDTIGGGSAFVSVSGNGLITFFDLFGIGLHRIDLRRAPFGIPSLEAVILTVAAHPTEPVLALGMRSGRILLIGVTD